ncbi:hypothetical protein VIGAN_02048400 [Vigna angularis var. angularis]|uniref:Uncharacterized protein n=1 Tax=Vigna angularis var. angularis TaxID=157739 RepID=A0A0S3RAV0_PHAAN|nr:hypothetical protein VIGAN_02048400 [Vigna angularis var. angularis]
MQETPHRTKRQRRGRWLWCSLENFLMVTFQRESQAGEILQFRHLFPIRQDSSTYLPLARLVSIPLAHVMVCGLSPFCFFWILPHFYFMTM